MVLRRVAALLLALLTACGGNPRAVRPTSDPFEAELAAARYELSILSPRTGDAPVEVDVEAFREAMAKLARRVRPSARPAESARQLFEVEQEVEFLVQVEDGQVVRMVPLDEGVPQSSRADEALTLRYLHWCERTRGAGDCLGLLEDGPTVHGEDKSTLALAIALGEVLDETTQSLREMADSRAVLKAVLWTVLVYLMLWMVPEPVVSKGLATAFTLALLAWLTVDTVWELMSGWVRLVEESKRASTFEELRSAGDRYGKVLGQNSARVLVMLGTAALAGSAAKLSERLPLLPGFARASARAEAHGSVRLAAVGEVESVAVSSEGTFSILARSNTGARGAAPSGPRPSITTLIQHRGGHRQVLINGERWHVPANRSVRDIPASDPVGNQLQAAATQAAQSWNTSQLSARELTAIERALSQGRHWLARLLERQARGRFVERELRKRFRHLRWNQQGADVVDPATGHTYEILSGTESNLALHGQRMADLFFRMITF
jgi:hypothetical protein